MSQVPNPTVTNGKATISAAGLLLPAVLLVVISLLFPTLILLRYSFNSYDPITLMQETFTLANYVSFLTQPYFHEVIANTVFIALTCTVASVVLGFPVAYFLARTKSRYKSLLIILTVFPLFVGNVVRASGWMAILGSQGPINIALVGLGIVDEPVQIMYTTTAVILGTLSVVLPIMILSLQSILETIDYSVMDAALSLGASRSTAFRRVLLPLARPGIIAGSVFVFILCMNAYATPYLLGGPGFKMMSPALYQQMAKLANWPMGAAMAFVLMIVTIIATGATVKILGGKNT